MPKRIRVTVWGENVPNARTRSCAKFIPRDAHLHRAGVAEDRALQVRTATLQQAQHGLTKSVLAETDVLVWWGHAAHGKVRGRWSSGWSNASGRDGIYRAAFIALFAPVHAPDGHELLDHLAEAGEKERLWVCNPGPDRPRDRALF